MAREGMLRGSATAHGDGRGAPWAFHVLRAHEQALDDVARSGVAEVTFVRLGRTDAATDHLAALGERALATGFVVAHVAAHSDAAFDTLEGLVRAVGRGVIAPGAPRARTGVVALLEAFAGHRGKDALAAYDAGAERAALRGDLASLARGYLAAAAAGGRRAAGARIEAWLAGTQLARAGAGDAAGEGAAGVEALSSATAKRALGDVTRLALALGHRGTLVTVAGADLVARLSPARRDAAYTVLRELVDNADGGRGLVATQVVVAASTSFFEGPRSLASLAPLRTRVEATRDAPTGVAPPHRPILDLAAPEGFTRAQLPPVRPAPEASLPSLRAIVRVSHGLPPLELDAATSVGVARLDRAVDALFGHTDVDGSVFALLVGEYGAGKTHFLLHLAARALAARRPVLRLSLERLDADLGHPERHLARMLDSGLVPPAGTGGPFERLARWTRTPDALAELTAALEAVARAGGEAAPAAEKALAWASQAARPRAALASFLAARDLSTRRPRASLRHEAYGRLLLWLALLERLDGSAGPVLLIDEAENLYRAGLTPAERRTALRSLAFYCGGTLPRACVVLAVTPDALAQLRDEAPSLLADVAEQRTVLASEDATMLCRRLAASRPIDVPRLDRAERAALLERLRAAHAEVRGACARDDGDAYLAQLASEATTPRELVRRATDYLERTWWTAGQRGATQYRDARASGGSAGSGPYPGSR